MPAQTWFSPVSTHCTVSPQAASTMPGTSAKQPLSQASAWRGMVRSAEPPVSAMSNVVNLGRARKRKQRADEQRRADENAIRHGRTKAEKARERMEQARLRATVDGARREPGAAKGDPTDGPTEEPTGDPTEHDPTQDGPRQDEPDA